MGEGFLKFQQLSCFLLSARSTPIAAGLAPGKCGATAGSQERDKEELSLTGKEFMDTCNIGFSLLQSYKNRRLDARKSVAVPT
jgi:hypothetical protein